MKNLISVDESTRVLLTVLVSMQLLFNNGIYLCACIATLVIVGLLVQEKYKSGVFLFMLIQHILQIVAGIWLANYNDKPLNYRSAQTSTAIIASLIGVVILFIPIIYAQRKLPVLRLNDMKRIAGDFSSEKTMQCYVAAFFIGGFLKGIAFVVPSITQMVITVVKIKWLFFLLFAYTSILKNERKKILLLFIAVEFFSGFISFFSEFKTVIFFVLILFAGLTTKINFKQMIMAGMATVGLVFFGLFWTSIKTDYRAFLNGGEKSQTVQVSSEDAVAKLQDLSSGVKENKISSSTTELLDRIQYTYHFAKAIERVPAIIPFQNGNNLLQTLEFSTTPRFLNPNKPIVDNSLKTTKYTGIRYASGKQGVSFSLGYFAEFYIDFGLWGMMVCLLILGIIYGKVYSYLMRKSSKNLIFNYAVAASFFFEFYNFEMDGTALIGRFIASLVMYYLLIKFFFPTVIKFVMIQQPGTVNSSSAVTPA